MGPFQTELAILSSLPPPAAVDLVDLVSQGAARALPLLPCLLGAAAFATLRVALQRSTPSRVLAECSDPVRRARLEPLLTRADSLATSALVFEVACRAGFGLLVLWAIVGEEAPGWADLGFALLVIVPTLLFLCDAVPTAIALRQGDALLRRALPAFARVQLPLRWAGGFVEAARRALLRMVGLEQDPHASRQLVEGLREVIEEAELSGDLDETEREIIGNVIETRDATLSAVMTPRTEIFGVEVREGLVGAARVLAECGHSRIPVYDGSLDTILGTVSARDVVQAAATGRLDRDGLRDVLRPAWFVPETKGVRELLADFRREKIKLAIVLDEYGGTAGLVSLGDIVNEIVGEIEEGAEGAAQPIRRQPDGSADVDATLHVSEVNEELETEIPEGEDYETLAGFVLSELGHVPKRGESFRAHGAEFRVLDASDRRVLRVGVRRMAAERTVA
jgi:CBS domain containing-hemolysin-like protein